MINEIKKHGEVIKEALDNNNNLSLSDMARELPLVRCQIRVAVAYLLGTEEITEKIYGRTKVYFLE